MSNINAWIVLVLGGYTISLSFLIDTRNFISTLIMKIIPFFLGLGGIFVALKLFQVI